MWSYKKEMQEAMKTGLEQRLIFLPKWVKEGLKDSNMSNYMAGVLSLIDIGVYVTSVKYY